MESGVNVDNMQVYKLRTINNKNSNITKERYKKSNIIPGSIKVDTRASNPKEYDYYKSQYIIVLKIIERLSINKRDSLILIIHSKAISTQTILRCHIILQEAK